MSEFQLPDPQDQLAEFKGGREGQRIQGKERTKGGKREKGSSLRGD